MDDILSVTNAALEGMGSGAEAPAPIADAAPPPPAPPPADGNLRDVEMTPGEMGDETISYSTGPDDGEEELAERAAEEEKPGDETAPPPAEKPAQPPAALPAAERDELIRLREQSRLAQEGWKRALADPAELARMKTEAGIQDPAPQVLDPVKQPRVWIQDRAKDYLAAGWKADDPRLHARLNEELRDAQAEFQTGRLERLENQIKEREQAEQRRTFLASLDTQTNTLLKSEKFKAADNEMGRELISALRDQALALGRRPDLPAIVSRVAGMQAKLIQEYRDKKTDTARRTGPLMRGGGVTPAPARTKYTGKPSELHKAAARVKEG